RKASKNQHKIGTETLLCAGWVVVITSLNARYCEEEILLWLILWTIAECQAFQAECFFTEKKQVSYTTYEECKISFIQVISSLCLPWSLLDRKSTRLNSSHVSISYAVFCLKKKKKT